MNGMAWDKFKEWAHKNDVGFENDDDWLKWWDCWADGYEKGLTKNR